MSNLGLYNFLVTLEWKQRRKRRSIHWPKKRYFTCANNTFGSILQAKNYPSLKFKSAAQSISYKKHLLIVRGEGQYLFDEADNKYLDCVNNVCHGMMPTHSTSL